MTLLRFYLICGVLICLWYTAAAVGHWRTPSGRIFGGGSPGGGASGGGSYNGGGVFYGRPYGGSYGFGK